MVEIENGNIRGNELSYLKNIKIISTYNSINSDVIKFNIAAFLSEILSMILKNHNADIKLFDFLKSSFEWFEKSENYSSFHVLFMVYITKFLGIYPEKNINNHLFFDLENGCFSENQDSTTCISGQVTNDLSLILGTQFDYSNDVLYNVTRRREMIDLMLKYYIIHLPGFKIPKSLEILNELFPKHILILFFSFFFISLNSQTISVIDENSGEGIPNVLLYNSDKSKGRLPTLMALFL